MMGGGAMKTSTLGCEAMAAIGREQRLLYREIIVEGVPDHFAAILRRLDQPMDQSTPPAAPSAASQPMRRDDGVPNGNTHERRALAVRHGLTLAAFVLALGFAC